MDEKMMQHGVDWGGQQDVKGYIATEKFNGCRAYWDGFELWSRGGLKISLPDAWRMLLPKGIHLDGEIYDGIDGVYRCGAAIKYGRFMSSMRFIIFDCPTAKGDYADRLNYARQYASSPIDVVKHTYLSAFEDALSLLNNIIARGGEGLMLHKNDLQYIHGYTSGILKLKGNFLNEYKDRC